MSAADDAWQEWNPIGNAYATVKQSPVARQTFLAGYRRALEDAADRDDLAAILAKHRHKPIHETETFRGVRESYQIGVGCRCGWGAEGGYQEDDHRAHVAQMVLESDWLRERDRANWNEGHAMHCDDTECGGTYDGTPHRADCVDAEDGEN